MWLSINLYRDLIKVVIIVCDVLQLCRPLAVIY